MVQTKAKMQTQLPKAVIRRLLGLSRREAIQFRNQVAGLGIETPDDLKLFVEADGAWLRLALAELRAKRPPKALTKAGRLVRAALVDVHRDLAKLSSSKPGDTKISGDAQVSGDALVKEELHYSRNPTAEGRARYDYRHSAAAGDR